jgi:hypothetical protein
MTAFYDRFERHAHGIGVIGGQLFSKSLRGLTVFKLQMLGPEGFFVAAGLLMLPLVILFVLTRILPPWPDAAAPVVDPS